MVCLVMILQCHNLAWKRREGGNSYKLKNSIFGLLLYYELTKDSIFFFLITKKRNLSIHLDMAEKNMGVGHICQHMLKCKNEIQGEY